MNRLISINEVSKRLGVSISTLRRWDKAGVLEIITVFSARLYGSRSKKNKKLLEAVKMALE